MVDVSTIEQHMFAFVKWSFRVCLPSASMAYVNVISLLQGPRQQRFVVSPRYTARENSYKLYLLQESAVL